MGENGLDRQVGVRTVLLNEDREGVDEAVVNTLCGAHLGLDLMLAGAATTRPPIISHVWPIEAIGDQE